MKKKNQEALRTALNEFQDAYRVLLDDEMKMQEAEERNPWTSQSDQSILISGMADKAGHTREDYRASPSRRKIDVKP